MQLIGCDFTSSPSRRKPILIARGSLRRSVVVLERLERLETLDAFSAWLHEPGEWVGGFDLPFGLPRELILALGWPEDWEAAIGHYARLSRSEIRLQFKAFCDSRPVGGKFAHRACDRTSGASSSMKWVNPPVAYMLHAGVPRLLAAGVSFPGLKMIVAPHVALEAYPGLLAREILGRQSYKSDSRPKQNSERLIARKDVICALEAGRTRLGLRLKLTHAQSEALADDASGDSLDAVLCLVQAAWGAAHFLSGDLLYGLPKNIDPLEGWILSASAS